MDKKNLAKRLAGEIRKARIACGKTQLFVLNDTGINIGRIERGSAGISICTLLTICENLDVDVGDIIAGIKKI